MKKQLFIIFIFLSTVVKAQDWKDIPVPAAAGDGMMWELQNKLSDSFNYEGKGTEFRENWNDRYHNSWLGPGLTEWNSNHSAVTGGNLQIKASRKAGTNKVYCGVVTGKQKVIYPVYMEARIKASNQVLSSNFWMLSDDDTREIDVVEVYGGDRSDQTWFASHMSTNYHIFERNPQTNAIIANHNDQTHFALPNNEPWRNDYHTFGVYWKSATEMTFYIDGEEKNTFTDQNMTDPSSEYFNRELNIIIDTEDHDWRSDQGVVATDAELSDNSKNIMYVDWVRVYKPVEAEVRDIKFPSESLQLKVGQSQTLEVEINPEEVSDTDIDFTSENTAVVTVTENGIVQAVGEGTTNIVVQAGDVTKKMPVTVSGNITSLSVLEQPTFLLYPNPTKGRAKLSGLLSGNYTLEVFDITGRSRFKNQFLHNTETEIDFSVLPAGLYYTVVNGLEVEAKLKLIIR